MCIYVNSAQNISDMLEKQHGIVVGVARINLPAPIKVRWYFIGSFVFNCQRVG